MENVVEESLARVGPGTPSGEVFRCYWLPVEVSANLGGGRGGFLGTRNPLRIRVLGENLVLFRDGSADPCHTDIGHGWAKGAPVMGHMHHGSDGEPATPLRYDRTPWGARYVELKNTDKAGLYEYHETHAVFPCQRCSRPGGATIIWALP